VNHYRITWIRPTILVAGFAVAALVLGQPAPRAADVGATATDSGRIAAPPAASAGPTTAPAAVSPRATPRGKEIYKGHTLEEILADPALFEEANSLSDYIRPVHGEPEPAIPAGYAHTLCLDEVECR
jgi:hypothetical protein